LFDARTTGYRWIHGESDAWPGLVLDRYDRTLVLKLYTAAWLPWLGELARIIGLNLRPERLVLRLSRNIQQFAQEHFRKVDGAILSGPPLHEPVLFQENGLRFAADVVRGQKTGFFLDQRENRRLVEKLAEGRAMLNTFSFSGGFSLYAARGGARAVTDLDLSAHALAASKRNFELNGTDIRVRSCPHEYIQADAFEWLAAKADQKFSLIVLDPPSLAKRETERAGAILAYRRLAAHAIKRLIPGGILVACSCSAHVSEKEFFETVRNAAAKSGRAFEELDRTGQPLDHPACFKEAHYLKAIYLRL
jgi:23S rRNA (cytosine1962-C5)-methyltransferase